MLASVARKSDSYVPIPTPHKMTPAIASPGPPKKTSGANADESMTATAKTATPNRSSSRPANGESTATASNASVRSAGISNAANAP